MINIPLFIGFHTSQVVSRISAINTIGIVVFERFPPSLLLSQDCTAFRQMVMVHTMGKVRKITAVHDGFHGDVFVGVPRRLSYLGENKEIQRKG